AVHDRQHSIVTYPAKVTMRNSRANVRVAWPHGQQKEIAHSFELVQRLFKQAQSLSPNTHDVSAKQNDAPVGRHAEDLARSAFGSRREFLGVETVRDDAD